MNEDSCFNIHFLPKIFLMIKWTLDFFIFVRRFGVLDLFSEVNAGFFYKSADEREKLVKAERQFTDNKVKQVIAFKKKLCDGTDKGFVIINQKVSHLIF